MKERANYISTLEKIEQDCLKLLDYGSPEWPDFKNNPTTKDKFSATRNDSANKIPKIQLNYMRKLHASGIPPEKIDEIVQEDKHQFELRKQYALLSVAQVKDFHVAACNEMTQLVMVKIKEHLPQLKVQFAVLKHYNHAFVVIENPDENGEKLVFDLFAHGFKKPVIYSIKDIEKNMGGLELKEITAQDITPLNKKYHEVWKGSNKPPIDAYTVKLELNSGQLFPQSQNTNHYSASSLCLKLGVFAAVATATGISYYLANSVENDSSLNVNL